MAHAFRIEHEIEPCAAAVIVELCGTRQDRWLPFGLPSKPKESFPLWSKRVTRKDMDKYL